MDLSATKSRQIMTDRLNLPPLAESRRTPGELTVFNDADNIERYLLEDGHKVWGWVIYRSTYDSEDDWTGFLSRLRSSTEKTLKWCGGLDLLDSLDYEVFDDRELFKGASTSKTRGLQGESQIERRELSFKYWVPTFIVKSPDLALPEAWSVTQKRLQFKMVVHMSSPATRAASSDDLA